MDIVSLERLPPYLRKRLKGYLDEFLRIHKENLLSIILYGSATGKEFVPGDSDINILAIFKEIDPHHLKKTLPIVMKWRKRGITSPLCLTERHILSSIDVFPIEFLELKENHILLWGKDPLEDIEVDTKNLRLAIEEQLKGKLIRLRQTYLEIGRRPKQIASLLIKTFTTLIPAFRNILRLKGIVPPISKKGVIEALGSEFGVNEKLLKGILKIKMGSFKPKAKEIESMFGGFVEELERLAVEIDRLGSGV